MSRRAGGKLFHTAGEQTAELRCPVKLDAGTRGALSTAMQSSCSHEKSWTALVHFPQSDVLKASMSVLLIVGPNCTLAASHLPPGESR